MSLKLGRRDKKGRVLRDSCLLLVAALMVGGVAFKACQVFAEGISWRQPNDHEKAFIRDPFDIAYSKGVLFRTGSDVSLPGESTGAAMTTTVGAGVSGPTVDDCKTQFNTDLGEFYCARNMSRQDNVWVLTKNGAIYNNKYLDVKEYIWMNGVSGQATWARMKGSSKIGVANGGAAVTVFREFHFFEAGTSNEVSFKGVVAMNDFDDGEGVVVNSKSGYHQAWVQNPTFLEYFGAGAKYDGNTALSANQMAWMSNIGTTLSGRRDLWAEVDGTSSTPLVLAFVAPHNTSAANYSDWTVNSNTVNYKLQGTVPTGVTAPASSLVVRYGTVTVADPVVASGTNLDGYTFSGWYTDSAMKYPVGPTEQITANTTFYGQYTKAGNASVTTSATQGTITPTNTAITPGTDFSVTYSCNEGTTLNEVAVDGVLLDVTKYPSAYEFKSISGAHTVNVVCGAATTGSSTSDEGGESGDDGGDDGYDGDDEYTPVSGTYDTTSGGTAGTSGGTAGTSGGAADGTTNGSAVAVPETGLIGQEATAGAVKSSDVLPLVVGLSSGGLVVLVGGVRVYRKKKVGFRR